MDEAGIRLGKNYAQAVFELACQSNMTDEVKGDLEAIMSLYGAESGFKKLMTWPYFTFEEKRELLGRLLAGKITDLTMNFMMIAVKHDRMAFLPQIIDSYNDLWDARNKYSRVRVTTSRALSVEEKDVLSRDIAAILNRGVRLEAEVNPSVIGGIVIRYDGHIIDNSVASRLGLAVKTVMSKSKRRS